MFRIGVGEYQVCCQADGLPETVEDYRARAKLSERFDDPGSAWSSQCFISVGKNNEWPSLVVTQESPLAIGFHPGALLLPETGTLFVGAGTRLLAYDVLRSVRLWEDWTDCGFWSWSRYGSVVILAAETEIAAFDDQGCKLWTSFADPPWDFEVTDDLLTLNMMGTTFRLGLRSGKPI